MSFLETVYTRHPGYSLSDTLQMTSFDFNVVSPANLTVTQLDETVAIAVRAYDSNPSIRAMAGGNKALYDPLLGAVTRALVLEGKIWLAVSNGRIVGVLGGFGPGTFLWATEEQRALGFDSVYASLSEETKNWWQNIYGPKIKEFMDNALGKTANLDGWMIPLVAVDPPFQCRGIATAMFKEMTSEAIQDKAVMVVGADSDLNVRIYESFGFILKGKTILASSVQGESYPLFALKKIP